VRLNSKKRIRR